MLHDIKNAAENFRNGLTTADEFLGSIINAIGVRYAHAQNPDPGPMLDVDHLAEHIHKMKLPD